MSKKTKLAVFDIDGTIFRKNLAFELINELAWKGVFKKEQFEEPSIFPFEEIVVFSKKPFIVETDGNVSKEIKVKIKLAKSRIEMVVGKERKF